MYQVGDRVVHPMHGAGIIESIVQERLGGQLGSYYVFRMPSGGLTLKIPTGSVIKGLMWRDREKGLSNGERKMLHSAKQILVSEVVLVEGHTYPDAEQRIEQAMMTGAKNE